MSPLLYQLSYRARGRDASTARGRRAVASDTLRGRMLILGDEALGQTLALLATFLGIGALVNVLIVYIVALVLAEHKENQEADNGAV